MAARARSYLARAPSCWWALFLAGLGTSWAGSSCVVGEWMQVHAGGRMSRVNQPVLALVPARARATGRRGGSAGGPGRRCWA